MSRPLTLAFTVFSLCLFASASARADDFEWNDDDDRGVCTLYYGDQPVLAYVYTVDESSESAAFDTTKVFHHVYGPGTDTQITKGPGGLFPHHRGLFVGWNKSTYGDKTRDFWHCNRGERLRHIEFVDLSADDEKASMTARVHWTAPEDGVVIEELRTVAVRKLPVDAEPEYGWQIDWSSKLTSKVGDIRLDGDRQHAGFQFRASQEVAENTSARYTRPDGHPQEPEAYQVDDRKDPDKHVDLGWLAMTCLVGGEKYTVEYFEDPSLPSPSRYSERPYGRFGAFFATDLKADQPLTLRYRLNVTRGDAPQRAAIQKRYDEFVKSLAD